MSYTTWNEGRHEAIEKCVLPMSSSSHKGSSGRVGVLGGSARYTGAPYYAAMASLKVGADLAYVFCAQEAAMPIKCYSPELMVAPVYSAATFDKAAADLADDASMDSSICDSRTMCLIQDMVQEVVSMMDRMHVLVVGPGLGRCPMVMRAVAEILKQAMERNLALVLDADALFMLTLEQYRDLLSGYQKLVLTPNVMEHRRLVEANALSGPQSSGGKPLDSAIVVKKGRDDVILVNGEEKMVCQEEGGMKRSGGLGDLLSGTLGTFVAWNQILGRENGLVLACWSSCCVVKRSTRRAYDIKRRSMTAPDVLEVIGETVDEMTR